MPSMSNPARTLSVTSPPAAAPEADAEALAALLKAAGDPLRLQILRILNNNAFGALELSEIFAMKQNAMSHHLKLLSKAGLVSSRREGTHIFYRRSNDQGAYRRLNEEICHAVNQLRLPQQLQLRLDAVQDARGAASLDFFRRNADKFREQQDLIASFPQYGEAVLATLDRGSRHTGAALEVGPGQGELLAGLCKRFERVIALDNSREMLEQARGTAARQRLGKVAFLHGDTASPALAGQYFDAITLNMVLHHTPVPAAIIADLATHLVADGLLLVTELCEHDQDWVREACGDLWLGFHPEELGGWAIRAGLVDSGSEFLALKNGFSIQIRQFRRAAGAADPTTGVPVQ